MSMIREIVRRFIMRGKSGRVELDAEAARLRQIDEKTRQLAHEHEHEGGPDVIEDMHVQKKEIRHFRRVEHHARDFWNDPRQDHPEALLADRNLGVHVSASSDRAAARDQRIKYGENNNKLYNYTSELPIIKDE